jgi:NUMOD4 motif/HNH endonuclease
MACMSPELEYAEEWLPITGWEGFYEVSNCGRVRSVARLIERKDGRIRQLSGKLLRPGLAGGGYPFVHLYRPGKKKQAYIHALVAAAFIGPCPPLAQVDHNDGNKLNNFFGNLEYVSGQENMRRAGVNGLMRRGERHHAAKLTDAQVTEVRRLRLEGMTHQSIADNFGVTRECISRILQGKNRKRKFNSEGQEI